MPQSTIERPQFSGFLLPAPWWTAGNLWAAQSSYTQASPRAPDVYPGQADGLGLVTSGVVTAIDDYDVRLCAAGYPSTDGASWAWRLDGGADDTWRGWDPPSVLSGWQALFWDTGGASGVTATSTPHVVALDDGSLLVACQRTSVVGPVTSYQVAVYRIAPDGTETAQVVYTDATAPANGYRPLLVVMPQGAVLLYAVVDGALRSWQSTNRGQTWALYRAVSAIDVYDLRIRGCANASGDVLLIAAQLDGSDYLAHQLVSTDGGATFREVYASPTGSTTREGLADVVALGDQFIVITGGGTNQEVVVFRPQYAAQPLSSSASTTFNSADEWTGSGECACCVDGSAIYFYTRISTASTSDENDVVGYRSPDGGVTWQPIGQAANGDDFASYATVQIVAQGLINGGSLSSSYPTDISAAAHAGRVVLASNWTADTGTTHNASLALLWLGGWTSVEMPQRGPSVRVDYRAEWSYSFLPFDLPSDVGWLTSTTGTASAAIQTPGEIYVATAPGTFSYYTPVSFQSSAGAAGIMVEMDIHLTAVEDGTQDLFAVKVRSYSSTVGNDVIGKVRAWRTLAGNISAALFDDVAGTQIGSTVTVSGDEATILMHVQHGGAVAYLRSTGRGLSRVWTLIGEQTSALTTTATVGSEVRYGTLFSDTTEWAVRRVCIAKGATDVGDGLVGLDYPADLRGRPCSILPAWMTDGVRVAFSGGPGSAGDLWDLAGAADYPLRSIFPDTTPSPSDAWRTDDGAPVAQQTVAVALDPTLLGTADGDFECDAIGLAIFGANWREGELQGYDVGSSAWVKIADIDLAAGLTAFDWTRAGATVRLGGQAGRYIYANEFEGATLNLNGKLRRIGRHLEGRASTDTTIRQIVLPFEGVDGTEGASGSGTAAVWARNGVLIVYLNGATYAALRVVIDSQSTVDGYVQAGTVMAGPLQVVRGPSNGWSVRVEAETERVVGRGGQAFSKAAGPRRRVVRFGFADGLYAGDVEGSPRGMAASSSSGAQGVWTEQGQAAAMRQVVDYLRGAVGSVVWLPRLVRGGGGNPDAYMLTRYDQLVLLEGPDVSEVENIQGDPLENELQRVASFRLREVR